MRVALETTLLVHGVPPDGALELAERLRRDVRAHGCEPALIGVIRGRCRTDLDDDDLRHLIDSRAPKLNTANLGIALHRHRSGATTVSTTMRIAADAGIRFFATGGLGGIHRGLHQHLDVSADLAAMTRCPVAVVSSGVKSILDVAATREALESLGIPVVGYRCDHFPAFYRRRHDDDLRVDERFDDDADLAAFAVHELDRTGRAVVICNPIPEQHEIDAADWRRWVDEAERRSREAGVTGPAVTPFMLGCLHACSGGATLQANIELVRCNASLAARLTRHAANV